MRKISFLVIDEVSMVRSDLMWAIDQSLRINRGRPRGAVRRRSPALCSATCISSRRSCRRWRSRQHLESEFGGPFFFSCPAPAAKAPAQRCWS